MAEDNVLTGGIETLYTMKENLLELEGYKQKSAELAKEEEKLEKDISLKEKAINDEISEVTKKRKDDIENSFEEQISKTKVRLKKVKAKKDKLKDAKVSERIKIETSELMEERRQLKEEIKSVFRLNHIPRAFNNNLYYSIYYPRSIKDILIIRIAIALCFLALPVCIYQGLLPKESKWLIITYFVTVLVFGGVYVIINHITKEKHQEVPMQIRTLRSKLAVNLKKIKVIERGIRKDKDESGYGLDKFNDEIADLETEVANITEEKKAALVTFETTTKYVIIEEIKNRKQKELDDLKMNHGRVYEEQRNAEEKVKQYSLEISSKYESFVGKENMSIDRINRLIELVESGEVTKVSDAIAANKQMNDTEK